MVHVGMKIRADLKVQQGHKGFNVSSEECERVVPESLFLLLSVVFGSEDAVEQILGDWQDTSLTNDPAYDESISDNDEDNEIENKQEGIFTTSKRNMILSVAQDIVYIASNGRKMTPKHIGLASTLHQHTRSRKLVNLFNKAGHCISYPQLLKIDTSLAMITLASLDNVTGAVTPPNFKPVSEMAEVSSILHVTADNVDILTNTLDGSNTFHATQMVAFQRGSFPTDEILKSARPSAKTSLVLPEALGFIAPCKVTYGTVEPVFSKPVDTTWYEGPVEMPLCVRESQVMDAAFLLQRQFQDNRSGWTAFNINTTITDIPVSEVGYMPLILQPAHEMNTLLTVMLRSIEVANRLGQKYIVLTMDQALYCRVVELKSSDPNVFHRLIPRMGGLHLAMNFLKCIGQHMVNTGLVEIWTESRVLAEGSVHQVLEGKAYNRGMRVHKLTYQALWRILIPRLLQRIQDTDVIFYEEIISHVNATGELLSVLRDKDINKRIYEFVDEEKEDNANFCFWWTYMEMVGTLLQFTRSIRDGQWQLYRDTLSDMLPYVTWYDHLNYKKSLSVYIAEMWQLPEEVETAFGRGDFGVKRTASKFNQVDPDHAQEWLVGAGKDSGGIVGITMEDSALQRWALTYHWRTDIAQKTLSLYGTSPATALHNELNHGRQKRDQRDEDAIFDTARSFGVFDNVRSSTLQNVATKDVATAAIQLALLNVKENGRKQVIEFIKRFSTGEFQKPMKKNNPLTFGSLFKPDPSKPAKKAIVMKDDRRVLNKLMMAKDGGRSVDMPAVLKHEMHSVPPSLAENDGQMRGGNKAVLQQLLLKNVDSLPELTTVPTSSHLIIDGMALINVLGKPPNAKTFGDVADNFINHISQFCTKFARVDIVLDRYRDLSVKGATRKKRSKKSQPIRKVVDSRSVPVPKSWENFMAMSANKTDLVLLLSTEVIQHNFHGMEVVVSGGFTDERAVLSTVATTDMTPLQATHEEADTRMILHAVHSPYETLVVSARDTDVLALLVHHFCKMPAKEVFMKAGTAKNRNYIPVHSVCETLDDKVKGNLLAFHSITGCDVTSFIGGIGKRKAWEWLEQQGELLSGLGETPDITEDTIALAEKFITKLYNVENVTTCDAARYALFGKCGQPENLPPTSDALRQHILRAHYQTIVWKCAHQPNPQLPTPTACGWREVDGHYIPIWTTIESVAKACSEIKMCGCRTGCKTNACKCRKSVPRLVCTTLCKCKGACDNVNNTQSELRAT